MKKTLLILSLGILLLSSCKKDKEIKEEIVTEEVANIEATEAEVKEILLNTIKDSYTDTENNLKNLERKFKLYEDKTNVSQLIEAFYNNDNTCEKLVQTSSENHGTEKYSFYFKKDSLYFVIKEEYEEASINGPFTDKQTRYYITNNEVIDVLYKEKTFTDSDDDDMSMVENINITETLNLSKIFEVLDTKAFKALDRLENVEVKNIKIAEGTWVNDEDTSTGMVILDSKWIFFSDKTEGNEEVFDFKIMNNSNSKDNRIILTKGTERYDYIIVANTANKLKLIYKEKAKTLNFTKGNK